MEKVEFHSGTSDLFYNIKNNKVLSYREDSEEIHQLCGGVQYYTSQTGLSGAGKIETRPPHILRIGRYNHHSQQINNPVHITDADTDLFIYVYDDNNRQDKTMPVVLTDGFAVCFVNRNNIYEGVKKLFKEVRWDGHSFKFPFYTNHNKRSDIDYLLKSNGFTGVDATRFIDARKGYEFLRNIHQNPDCNRLKAGYVQFLKNGVEIYAKAKGVITDIFYIRGGEKKDKNGTTWRIEAGTVMAISPQPRLNTLIVETIIIDTPVKTKEVSPFDIVF